MNLVRFNPSIKHSWHPGFAHYFDNLEKNNAAYCNETKGSVPSVNVIENDKDFVLEIAAPGFRKNEFNIKVENQTLTISREVNSEKEEKKENYTRREFVYGNFSRSFTLPKNVNSEEIVAKYNEGILTLSLPKKEKEAKLSREIKIS